MIEENGHIEKLFQEKFSDFSVQPSPGVWGKLAGKLFWKEFLSFDISSFNVYYLSAAVGVVATGIVLLSGPSDDKVAQDEASAFVETTADKKAPASSTKTVDTAGKKAEDEVLNRQTDKAEAEPDIIEQPARDNLKPPETTLKQLETVEKETTQDAKLIIKPPIADYTQSATRGCGTLTVQFSNRSQFASTYRWQFGDGGTSTEESPVHTYDEPGEYGVSLKATGPGGEVTLYGETIRVFEPPEANFVIGPEDVTVPEEPVTFYNRSENASRYLWDFGDLSGSAEKEPVHYYMEEGDYDVRLDVWNEAGCHDSMIVEDAFAGSGCRIEFPTAFAPNPNGPSNGYYTDGPTGNEVFHPVCQGVVEYRLRIYNRTGSLVFESNDMNIGWDGYIKGTMAKQDVYVWKAQGRFRNGKEFMEQGNVTLIVKR